MRKGKGVYYSSRLHTYINLEALRAACHRPLECRCVVVGVAVVVAVPVAVAVVVAVVVAVAVVVVVGVVFVVVAFSRHHVYTGCISPISATVAPAPLHAPCRHLPSVHV